jgi:hypothetical protein
MSKAPSPYGNWKSEAVTRSPGLHCVLWISAWRNRKSGIARLETGPQEVDLEGTDIEAVVSPAKKLVPKRVRDPPQTAADFHDL